MPAICTSRFAWLGIGYYFWAELIYAEYWGQDKKKSATGYYDIYKATLDIENCINASFSEEGYDFFRNKIDQTIDHFHTSGKTISLEAVHRFLAENVWPALKVDGIIFDDKPTNPTGKDRIHSEIPDLYYKRRIQIVFFNLVNIYNFEVFKEEQQ